MLIYVIFKNKLLGVLSENTNQFKFAYDDRINQAEYVHSLPVKENISEKLFAIFDDLIPENTEKIDKLKEKHNIRGTVEILLHLDNIHGSFSFSNNLATIELSNNLIYFEYKNIKSEILCDYLFPEILTNYQLQGLPLHATPNTTLGLSGVQEKYAVVKDDLEHLIKYSETPTEYFLKPFNLEHTHFNRTPTYDTYHKKAYYPYLLVNEHIFLSLAKEFGFDVPYNALIKDNKHNEYHLVIKRFDRYKTIYKFDHHTINSLLNRVSTDKYEVTVKEVIQVAKQYLDHNELLVLFKFIIFSVIISHGDLHAKNISLIYSNNNFDDKSMVLAPVYDVLTVS
jgi:serine/threonine-protein kinase HipA